VDKKKQTKKRKRAKPGAGRPSKLTPEVQEKILNAIRTGAFIETAAAAAGIHRDTFYEWMKRGEKAPSGMYREFKEQLDIAIAESETMCLALITAASASGVWQAAAWRLERRFPERWAQQKLADKTTVAVNGQPGAPGGVVVEIVRFADTPTEQLEPPALPAPSVGLPGEGR
jgi:transposase